jgi:hypothetical protein
MSAKGHERTSTKAHAQILVVPAGSKPCKLLDQVAQPLMSVAKMLASVK